MSDDWDWDALGRRSAALFRSQHRLPVALLAASADPEGLYAGEIVRRYTTGQGEVIDRKEAGRQLEALRKARLLERAAARASTRKSHPGRPPELFARVDDPAWAAIMALGDRFRR